MFFSFNSNLSKLIMVLYPHLWWPCKFWHPIYNRHPIYDPILYHNTLQSISLLWGWMGAYLPQNFFLIGQKVLKRGKKQQQTLSKIKFQEFNMRKFKLCWARPYKFPGKYFKSLYIVDTTLKDTSCAWSKTASICNKVYLNIYRDSDGL